MTKRSKKDQQGLSTGKNKLRLHASPSRLDKISKKIPKEDAKGSSPPEKNDWEDAVCPVCMESPHEAVLLLCSSHKKGCRPYLCDTSYEFSNCLERYKEACPNSAELSCPLCRGKVTGWTVVKPARELLNTMERSCSQENCSFSGNLEDLMNHMKLVHPLAKPKELDPQLENEWKRMEEERERNDLMTTVRATTPGGMVVGDYVIENPTSPLLDVILSDGILTRTRSVLNNILSAPDSMSLTPRALTVMLDIHRMLQEAVRIQRNAAAAALEPDASQMTERARSRIRQTSSMLQRQSARSRRQRSRRQTQE
ncbi:hypothetical protein QQ045_031353 [Rhodiola kirilowii]